MNVPVPPNFSFTATVVSHGWYLLAPNRWSRDERVLRRPEVIAGRAVDLAISCTDQSLIVEGARDSKELRAKLARMFQLNVDTSEFVKLTRNSEAHVWVERYGFGRLFCG